VLDAPSPKFHRHEVGDPEVVSANCTVCPGPGVVGLNTKVASEVLGRTVRVRIALLLAVPFAMVRVAFWNPDLE
jgi:hypothetical protein